MAQVSWVYLDDFGGRHRIGLYHGDRTGHLLVHCNLRIVQVDFSVNDNRTYSFFVEDELCEVHVYKENEGFSYDFQVNKKVDTPRNRLRQADYRRNRKYMAFLVAGLVVLVTGVFIGLRWWGERQKDERLGDSRLTSTLNPEAQQQLTAEGKTTVAELIVVHEALKRRVFYQFQTEADDLVSGYFQVPDTGRIILPNGFPLHDRDAFAVRYLPSAPRIHQVDFERPTARTLAVYLEQARLAEARAHPQSSDGRSLCIAKNTLEHKGWRQLADLIFQNTPVDKNPNHNRESYLRLVREPDFEIGRAHV